MDAMLRRRTDLSHGAVSKQRSPKLGIIQLTKSPQWGVVHEVSLHFDKTFHWQKDIAARSLFDQRTEFRLVFDLHDQLYIQLVQLTKNRRRAEIS